MTERDPAFLWETEAIRSAAHRVAEAEIDAQISSGSSERWQTLRAASRHTGIPVETLRKWARRGTIPSYLSPAGSGPPLRMVDIDGVTRRADELGRDIGPPAASTAEPPGPAPAPTARAAASEIPAGSMIVPIDAWNKMLTQLGNLHEAGQQLAVARERAAKAETEASFLKERLAELRRQVAPTASQPASPAQPATSPLPSPPREESVWSFVKRRVRSWRRG